MIFKLFKKREYGDYVPVTDSDGETLHYSKTMFYNRKPRYFGNQSLATKLRKFLFPTNSERQMNRYYRYFDREKEEKKDFEKRLSYKGEITAVQYDQGDYWSGCEGFYLSGNDDCWLGNDDSDGDRKFDNQKVFITVPDNFWVTFVSFVRKEIVQKWPYSLYESSNEGLDGSSWSLKITIGDEIIYYRGSDIEPEGFKDFYAFYEKIKCFESNEYCPK